MSMDENLAQSLFERGAEKCSNKDERIAYCKEYLKKHDINTEKKSSPIPFTPETFNTFGLERTFILAARDSVDRSTLAVFSQSNKDILDRTLKPSLINKLSKELIEHGFIKFTQSQDFLNNRIIVDARIKAAKWSDSHE